MKIESCQTNTDAVLEKMIQQLQLRLVAEPDNGDLLYFLGVSCYQLKNNEAAIPALQKAVQHHTNYDAEAYSLLSYIYEELKDYVQAMEMAELALEALPFGRRKRDKVFLPNLLRGLGSLQLRLGSPGRAADSYLKAVHSDKDFGEQVRAYSGYLLCLHYENGISNAELFAEHKKYQDFFANIKPFKYSKPKSKKKLRIGYLSPDFRSHVMFYFMYNLLTAYDHTAFEVICYSLGDADGFTELLQSKVDGWRTVHYSDYAGAAQLIYEDEIDILVELGGHSCNGGLPILAYKPAPIQVSGLGYVNTTGLETVDYFLTDRYVDPPVAGDNEFVEKLYRLPHSQFSYTGRSDAKAPQGAACIRNKFITFGCFNNFAKVTKEVLQVWQAIMACVPDSRLLLKTEIFNGASACDLAKRRLKDAGFDLERVELRGDSLDYLNEYLSVDIALDTFPYPGGGTTFDALYMGIPVLTLKGQRHGARFGYSILKNIGLDAWIAESEAKYIVKAIEFSKQPTLLDTLHRTLRAVMLESPLMDEKLYMKDIECMYQSMWQSYQAANKNQT